MKIFYIVSRVPYPIEKGDKLRAYYQIKHLSEKGYEIILCALNDKSIDPEAKKILSQYCSEVHIFNLSKIRIAFNTIFKYLFSRRSLQVSYFYQKSIHRKISAVISNSKPDHIFCQLVRVSEYVKDFAIPKTLDYMDALSRGMERQISKVPFYLKPFIKVEAVRLKRYEHEIFDYFDHHCIISAQDRSLIVHPENESITVIPNGIDMERFHYKESVTKKYDLLFTGNMSYPPNIDAALFLIREILPALQKKQKHVRLMIAGANPSKEILKYKDKENILISGWVEDLSIIYNQSSLFIAPMQIGTGLQNKLLEAMAMHLACITSPLANNALKAEPGEEILIAEDAEDYAGKIILLLENDSERNRIAKKGYRYVKNNFSWTEAVNKLEKLLLASSGE